jgi:hypothetical protein
MDEAGLLRVGERIYKSKSELKGITSLMNKNFEL